MTLPKRLESKDMRLVNASFYKIETDDTPFYILVNASSRHIAEELMKELIDCYNSIQDLKISK